MKAIINNDNKLTVMFTNAQKASQHNAGILAVRVE